MISLSGLVQIVVALVVVGLIFYLLEWLVRTTNPPEPFNKIAHVIIAVVAVIFIIWFLVRLVGGGAPGPVFAP